MPVSIRASTPTLVAWQDRSNAFDRSVIFISYGADDEFEVKDSKFSASIKLHGKTA